MAQLLASQGVVPDLLVSSPAKRALTTALFFAEQFSIPDNQVVREQDIYEADPIDILRIISQLPDAATTVCLFGHNPTFTDVANRFTENFIDNIPTCGIVRIESDVDQWNAVYEGNSRVTARFFPKELLKK